VERVRAPGRRRLRAGLSARVRRRRWILLPALVAVVPALAACAKPVGSTSVHNVAWVTTGASVTLPSMDVTPVNLSRRHIGAKVPVGSMPSAMAYTLGGKGLLVVTQGDDELHEIDPATHEVVHQVTVGVEPDAVAVAPGGTSGQGIALVANLDSDSVTPVDLGTWRAGAPIAVGSEPVAIAVSVPPAGGATAFVADYGGNTVTPIDVATMTAGAAIPVGPGPQTIAAAPGEVLVGNFGNRTLTAIDPASLRAGGTIALPLNPTGIAVAPSGATAYVCGGASVAAVTVLGLTVGTPVALPDVAQGIALSADGSTAWVTQQAGTLIPVALAAGRVGVPLHVGGHPSAIVIGPG
jgi:hyaluronoglucosaminidase